MTRIKQFANDMGLSYNQAKDLVMQGRKKKDGGSTVLEKFMPIEIVPKRKTDRARSKTRMKDKMDPTPRQKEKEKQAKQPIKKQSGGGFDEEFRELRERMRAEARAKAKPTAQSRKEKFPNRKKTTGKFDLDLMQGTGALKKEDFPPKKEKKISKPKKRTSPKVISPGKQKPTMTDEQVKAEIEAKTKPKTKRTLKGGAPGLDRGIGSKYFIGRKLNKGGKIKNLPKPHKLEKYLTKEEIKKIGPMGTELLLKVQEGVMKGRKKADGGVLKELPPASENPGLRKLPTEVRNKMGYKKKGGTMKMMGGGTYNMMPRKMSKGGVARGTGAAVKGTGFKGVY